jgi:ribosomal protein S18 acetylase RimI-like enzyme
VTGELTLLILRVANAEDEGAARQISLRAFRFLREIYRPTQSAIAEKDLSGQEYERLVAESGGQIVATVEYRLAPGSMHLRSLAVDPEFQRQGIARRLIDETVNIARERGLAIISLHTIRETGNVGFFERLGFHSVSEEIASWCESDRFEILHDTRMEFVIP